MKPAPSCNVLLALLFVFLSLQSPAQPGNITGKVTDQDSRQPLANVSVVGKGTGTAVVSDNGGAFSITPPSNATVLEFSFVGYAPKEIRIGAQTSCSWNFLQTLMGLTLDKFFSSTKRLP